MGLTNVTVLVPSSNVSSLQDEIADGSVAAAKERVLTAFAKYDSDGKLPVVEYDGDLAGAVAKALEVASASAGDDLVIIVSDGVTSDRAAVKAGVQTLVDDHNGLVIANVNNQPTSDGTAFLTELDDNTTPDRVDVLTLDELPGTEVDGWF